MAELGYDLSAHASKSLDEVKDHAPFDAVVTMGTHLYTKYWMGVGVRGVGTSEVWIDWVGDGGMPLSMPARPC